MKNLEKMIDDVEVEKQRVGLFLTQNDYHHGTAIGYIAREYRKKLGELAKTMRDDLNVDGVVNYRDCEHE